MEAAARPVRTAETFGLVRSSLFCSNSSARPLSLPPIVYIRGSTRRRALVARSIAQMRRLDSTDGRAPEMYFMGGLCAPWNRHSVPRPGSPFHPVSGGIKVGRDRGRKSLSLRLFSRLIGHVASKPLESLSSILVDTYQGVFRIELAERLPGRV